MYLPDAFSQTDVTVLAEAIRRYPFGTLITVRDETADVNHVPFVHDPTPAPFGTLRAHLARANAVWRSLDGTEALVVFHGPHGYISPSWYPSKEQTGKVVPTWNYVVVHARGTVRIIGDAAWLRHHIASLTSEHESRRETPWSVADAPAAFTEALLSGIVGVEITIASLIGKWKLSQNRTREDRDGVIDALTAERGPDDPLVRHMRHVK